MPSYTVTEALVSYRLAGWHVEILATDLSCDVIETARSGIYNHFEVQRGLPIRHLVKYFTPVDEFWQINPDIRAMVRFRQFNLLDDFLELGTFDVVFCRNVLIYFDQRTKIDVLERLTQITRPDGYLVLGAVETATGLTSRFEPIADRAGLCIPSGLCVPSLAAKKHIGLRAMPRLAVVGGGI